jgi:hypothetical protein
MFQRSRLPSIGDSAALSRYCHTCLRIAQFRLPIPSLCSSLRMGTCHSAQQAQTKHSKRGEDTGLPARESSRTKSVSVACAVPLALIRAVVSAEASCWWKGFAGLSA